MDRALLVYADLAGSGRWCGVFSAEGQRKPTLSTTGRGFSMQSVRIEAALACETMVFSMREGRMAPITCVRSESRSAGRSIAHIDLGDNAGRRYGQSRPCV